MSAVSTTWRRRRQRMKLGSLHKQRSMHPHLIAAAEKEAMGPTQSKEQVANATTCGRRLATVSIASTYFTFVSYERPQTKEFTRANYHFFS